MADSEQDRAMKFAVIRHLFITILRGVNPPLEAIVSKCELFVEAYPHSTFITYSDTIASRGVRFVKRLNAQAIDGYISSFASYGSDEYALSNIVARIALIEAKAMQESAEEITDILQQAFRESTTVQEDAAQSLFRDLRAPLQEINQLLEKLIISPDAITQEFTKGAQMLELQAAALWRAHPKQKGESQ